MNKTIKTVLWVGELCNYEQYSVAFMKIKLIKKQHWKLYKNVHKCWVHSRLTSCGRWEQIFLRNEMKIDWWYHPSEETPGNWFWWHLRQCTSVARLISLAIKFCYCHQGLDTFTGDLHWWWEKAAYLFT